ncbi:hypothetical protein V6Z12_D09G225300 [Gossypium hirsutum]
MVSHALRSVADCDAVWEKFLPSDYKSIISGSSSSSLLSPGKRRIYIFIFVSIPFSFKMVPWFSEVAELKLVWWLEVKGMIDIRILSYNTNYAAYLVFKLRNKRTIEFRHRAVGLHINVGGITSWEVRRVSEKMGGWMEVEMGEFFNEFGDDGTVQLSLREIDTSYYKQGLIIEGIELRPKDTGS